MLCVYFLFQRIGDGDVYREDDDSNDWWTSDANELQKQPFHQRRMIVCVCMSEKERDRDIEYICQTSIDLLSQRWYKFNQI